MDWKGNGALVALLGLAAAIVLFVVLSGGDDEPRPAPTMGVFEVELEERVVPIAEITVNPS